MYKYHNVHIINICNISTDYLRHVINHRRACVERVTVVVLCVCVCVCVCVCLYAHAILVVRAIKSVTKDTVVLNVRFAAILYWRFFLKLSYSKVRASFTHLGRDGHL